MLFASEPEDQDEGLKKKPAASTSTSSNPAVIVKKGAAKNAAVKKKSATKVHKKPAMQKPKEKPSVEPLSDPKGVKVFTRRDGTTYKIFVSPDDKSYKTKKKALENGFDEVRDRKLGKTASIMGAAMLSVDLSLAFDQVSHQYLRAALEFLSVDPDMITLILSIHRATYHVQHGQESSCFDICNGIRQGCTLSPLLWVCITHYMLHRFSLKAGTTARDSLVLFADDFISKFILRDMTDVQALATNIRYLFETLGEACMTVNPEKSKLHIKAAGVPLKKWLSKHTVTHKGVKCLALRTPFDTLYLPLCDQMTYLGAVISYAAFEDQSAEHRISSAQANVSRLARHLFTQHGLSLRLRLRLFMTCVRASLLYGIPSIGVTAKSLRLMQRFEAKHVRRLARAPAHLTHERTQDLYARLGLTSLQDALLARAQSSVDSFQKPYQFPWKGDLRNWQVKKLDELKECIQLSQSTTLTQTVSEGVPCPVCGVYFDTQHAMRAHATQKHSMIFTVQPGTAMSQTLDPRKHSMGGMPTCRHCKKPFKKWAGLRDHILNACSVWSGIATRQVDSVLMTLLPQLLPTFRSIDKLLVRHSMEPTLAEREVANVFGSSMPAIAAAKSQRRDPDSSPEKSKFLKTDRAKGVRGKGLGGRKPAQTRATGSQQQQQQETLSEETIAELLAILTRLALKHEDILAAVQADSCFMMYLDTSGDLSITTNLYQITQAWQTKKRDTPELLTQSLRVTLLTALFMELRERMNMALLAEKREVLAKHQWISTSDPATWNYQKWDPTTEAAVVDAAKVGVPHQEAIEVIQKIIQLVPSLLVQKFHSTRPQAAEYQSNVLPFMLMISNRGEKAQDLYNLFQKISDLSALRLIGARLRPHRQRRQPLALTLEDVAAELLKSSNRDRQPEGQICYMNSVITLFSWLVQAFAMDLPSPYGVMKTAFGTIKAGLKLTITNCLPWQTVIRQWFREMQTDLHAQQDAVAFAEFLLRQADIPAFRGTWEARTYERILSDSGVLPIRLELRTDLQACIDYWHEQAVRFIQALRVQPALLLLQISRFDPEDPLCKYDAPLLIEAGQVITMPCFDDAHSIIRVRYRVAGMIYHCGPTIHAGHYQTVLCTLRAAEGKVIKSFTAGMCTMGRSSVRLNTMHHPDFVRLVCAMIRDVWPEHYFTSFTVVEGSTCSWHRDRNNASGLNLVIPLTFFRQGALYIESPEAPWVTIAGETRRATRADFTMGPIAFDAHNLSHCAEVSEDRRIVCIAYCLRGIQRLSAEHYSFLCDMGFNAPLLDLRPGDISETIVTDGFPDLRYA
ncbi:unnamed protein product [Symbiodinium sp. CCMP2592]|nr:unnamed protein product [Symbiodinium sp. CCMP2592]